MAMARLTPQRLCEVAIGLLPLALLPFPAVARDQLQDLNDPVYWIQLCNVQYKTEPAEALPACERALELQPNNARLWARHGALQLAQKQYPDAIASLEQSLKRQPKSSQVLTNLCIAWTELGRAEPAVAACDKAIKLNVDWGDRSAVIAQRYRATVLNQPEVYQTAIGVYDQALAQAANDSLTLLYRAEALEKLGQYPQAIAACDQAINGNGNWGPAAPAIAWYVRGLAQRKLGERELAVQSFDRALQLNPTHVPSWSQLGDTLRQLKRPVEALPAYTRWVELQPNSSQALLAQCTVLNQVQQAELALATCKKAIQLNSDWGTADSAQSWNQQSLSLTTLGKPEDALAAANRAVGMRPDWADAWSDRAVVLWYLKRYEEALASVEKALALDPKNARAWANQARVWRSLDQPDKALAAYAEALKYDPQNAAILANQSAVQWSLGDHPAALESAKRAIAVNPDLAQAWQNRAAAEVALQQYPEAQTSYERALQLDKTNPESWTGLGLVLIQQQQYPKARQALQTAISLNPKQTVAQKALKALTELQQAPR